MRKSGSSLNVRSFVTEAQKRVLPYDLQLFDGKCASGLLNQPSSGQIDNSGCAVTHKPL